jgi:uncharacterized protein (TIGR02996 family)
MKEAAFLDALRARPDDDATRLVYADWLDEQRGATNLLRSEYLRLECHLAAAAPDSEGYADLLARRAALAKKLTRRWLDPSISRTEGDLEGGAVRMGRFLPPQSGPPLEE